MHTGDIVIRDDLLTLWKTIMSHEEYGMMF